LSDSQSSISQELKQLFEKTVETNRILLSETARFVKQAGNFKLNADDLLPRGKLLFQDALNSYVKLTIGYASNMLDLGVAISKRMNQQFEQPSTPTMEKPAFELSASGIPGSTVTVPFLLDSDKKDPLFCHLEQSEYIFQNNESMKFEMETGFQPQSFQLPPGEAQKVEITVKIPTKAKAGVYRSNIRVHGFEHVFFSLFLTVTEAPSSNQSSA
jgi:hypothetical protein